MLTVHKTHCKKYLPWSIPLSSTRLRNSRLQASADEKGFDSSAHHFVYSCQADFWVCSQTFTFGYFVNRRKAFEMLLELMKLFMPLHFDGHIEYFFVDGLPVHLGPSSFFPPFSVVRPSQSFDIFKKKKRSNDVVKPFFTWNNSFNLKMSIVTALRKTGTKTGTFFTVLISCILLIQVYFWMLTFTVILGYQGLLFPDFLWFLF